MLAWMDANPLSFSLSITLRAPTSEILLTGSTAIPYQVSRP
jgi:hypothetical protein